MTYIEIQGWGDFDVRYTDCIMASEGFYNFPTLDKEFFELEGITSFKNLDYRKLYEHQKNYIAFLELKGFKKLQMSRTILFCD